MKLLPPKVLSFSLIMLQTDLHNPGLADEFCFSKTGTVCDESRYQEQDDKGWICAKQSRDQRQSGLRQEKAFLRILSFRIVFLESFSHLLNSDPWRIYLGSTWKVSTMVRCVSAGYDPLKSFCRLLQPLTLDLEFNDVTQVFLRIQSHCKKTRRQRQLMCTDAHRQEASLKMAHQKTFRICQARNRQESQAARDLNQKHMPWLSGRCVTDDIMWQCFFSKTSKTYRSATVVCLLT